MNSLYNRTQQSAFFFSFFLHLHTWKRTRQGILWSSHQRVQILALQPFSHWRKRFITALRVESCTDQGKHTKDMKRTSFWSCWCLHVSVQAHGYVWGRVAMRGVPLSEAMERTHNNVLINISAGIVEDSHNEVSLTLSSPHSVLSPEPFALCNASSVRSLEQH